MDTNIYYYILWYHCIAYPSNSDNIMPPLINFLYDLNHTVQTGVLNDGVENLSWTAARLFDGTIVKQTLD